MALTAGQIIAIRREIGSEPDDAALNLAYDRLGSTGLVALEILETRYADLVSSPAQFTVFGEYGQNTSQNLIDMRMQLERLRVRSYIDPIAHAVSNDKSMTLRPSLRIRHRL